MPNPFFLNLSLTEVTLRVRSLPEMLGFYRETLGLSVLAASPRRVEFSANGQPPALYVLEEESDAPQPPPGSSGLFHSALLFPNRSTLAAAVRRLAVRGYALSGASDHGVSEAIYLDDPEGNGLELYADRPSNAWPSDGGSVAMATDPLDLQALLAQAAGPAEAPPSDLRLGHVHLRGCDLEAADRYYAGALGFPVRQRSYRGALFFGRDGYHHHLAVNIWQSRRPAPRGALGLIRFAIRLASGQDYAQARSALKRLPSAGIDSADMIRTRDPSGIELVLPDPAATP